MGHDGRKEVKPMAQLIGSSTSGVLEIGIFHPVDTLAKRLMSNTSAGGASDWESLKKVVFKENVDKGLMRKWLGLFSGVGFGAVYKVLQRTYKFGGQPIAKQFMDIKVGHHFRNIFGNKTGNDMLHATSGSIIGLGEIVLLPLDILKIKAQVNPQYSILENVKGVTVGDMYAGWRWTALRNLPGSFLLFGVNSLAYTRLFGIEGPWEAKFYQIFVASMCGGTCSILFSSPMDVIKTRIQNKPFGDERSGMKYVGALLKEEGPSAFFKGVIPKLGLIGPKLVFSFTIAQWLIAYLDDRLVSSSVTDYNHKSVKQQ